MKQYHLKSLTIELTRRCNYKCIHCGKGEPQNVTITPEIIDTMFSQCSQVDEILITGGEPLLEIDMLAYVLEAIDRYRLKTEYLTFVTNGSILDSQIIPALSSFVNRQNNRAVALSVSADMFHDQAQRNMAIQYYESQNHNRKIIVHGYTEHNYKEADHLAYSGRCKDYIDQHLKELLDNGVYIKIPENAIRSHQININNKTVECVLHLSANGLICLECDISEFENDDAHSFGNILTDSLETILQSHNHKCPYTCDEAFNESYLISLIRFINNDGSYERTVNRLQFTFQNKIMSLVWELRKHIQQQFPEIHMQEIILKIPAPSFNECMNVGDIILKNAGTKEMYNRHYQDCKEHYPFVTNEQLMKFAVMKCAIDLINDLSINGFAIIMYGSMDNVIKPFERIAEQYKTGAKIKPDNFDACALIPDSVDKRDEEADNDASSE